ncbi:MAG: LysM peptidoglycan-binding domain-containing protein [Oscillospiraceae bacterium]
MLRRIIFKNTKTNEELGMPVTPPAWQAEFGRHVENMDMAQGGEMNLPGLALLFNEQQDFLLPAEARSYTGAGYTGNPMGIFSKLRSWALAGDVVRYIVSGTPINEPVLLESVLLREDDGTNDATVRLTLRQWKAPGTDSLAPLPETGNLPRAPAPAAAAATGYTVVKNDNLWRICRKFYGDGTLCHKLARYNAIPNVDLIFPGQRLKIPPVGEL